MGLLQQLAGAGAAVGAFFLGANPLLLPVAFLAAFAATGGHETLLLIYKTLPRDLQTLYRVVIVKRELAYMAKNKVGIQDRFRNTVEKYPNKVAVVLEDEHWTFTELEEYANQVSHCFNHLGIRRGETIALFMDSKPEFIGLWIGMARIGVLSSFINKNLRTESLLHCITVCSAKAVVFGLEMKDAIAEIKDQLEENKVQLLVLGERGRPAPTPSDIIGVSATILDGTLANQPTTPADQGQKPDDFSTSDKLFYIYTSGTTGLPKPSKITHQRFFIMSYALGLYNNLSDKTVVYCPLPLYHTNGSVLAAGAALLFGGTLVLRRKMSASQFWDDCIRNNCNTMIYIGEVCRYLLSQPPKPTDSKHSVRLAMGNGLKKVLWQQFIDRFGVTNICEFYGATEANCNMANPYGRVGAVGFNSVLFPSVYPIQLVRIDTDTNEVIRDARGLCIPCQPGEAGELLGKIVDNDPLRRFDGYVDPNATERKILEDVKKHGDRWFRSGDILSQDAEGYFFFHDRTGDTFRWKGENVSTQEVEGHMQTLLGLQDVVVYGVEVPGCDGRAGMAAIVGSRDVVDGGVDMDELHTKIKEVVPAYATPIFLRIISEAELTGTFKLKKVKLAREGFDLGVVGDDPIYVNLPGKTGYRRLEKGELYDQLVSGDIRM